MKYLFFLFLSIAGLKAAYAQDWMKNSIPSDLGKTCLIVEKIDSVGMKCKKGRAYFYCNDFDKETDSKLSYYQKQQELLFKEYKNECLLVLQKAYPYQEYSDLKDVNKYRYILKMNTVEASDGSDVTYHWVYYIWDRKTGTAYPRIKRVYDPRLKSLKEIIDAINAKFPNSSGVVNTVK